MRRHDQWVFHAVAVASFLVVVIPNTVSSWVRYHTPQGGGRLLQNLCTYFYCVSGSLANPDINSVGFPVSNPIDRVKRYLNDTEIRSLKPI